MSSLQSIPGVIKGVGFRTPGTLPFFRLEQATGLRMPSSGLVEIGGPLGGGRTRLVFDFLKDNPTLRVAWIERKWTLHPVGAPPEVDTSRWLCVEAGDEIGWTILRVLRSQLFAVIVVEGLGSLGKIPSLDLKRLQIEAERAGTLIVILQPSTDQAAGGTWMFRLKLHVVQGKIQVLSKYVAGNSQNSRKSQDRMSPVGEAAHD